MQLIPLDESHKHVNWEDFSTMKVLTCKNHPTARYSTKNPWQRRLHILEYPKDCQGECSCPMSDLCLIVE